MGRPGGPQRSPVPYDLLAGVIPISRGWLVASAKLEPNGSFSFNDVPAGKYTLKVFRGGNELSSKDIEVTDKPLTLDPLTFATDKSGS